MKSKSTNILISIAALLSLLALIVRLVIFFGPQKFFVERFGGSALTEDYTNVSDPAGISKAIFLFLAYFIVCIITVTNKRKTLGKIACIVCIIVHFIFSFLYPIITTLVFGMFINNQGAQYIAAYSYLSNASSYLESPIILLALILLCIAFGTLIGNDEQQKN